MNISITITSTVRPSILYRTLNSFNSNLNDFSFKKQNALINIDPIPQYKNFKQKITKITDLCNFFFQKTLINTPKTPNFPLAIKWLWQNTNTDYILHLEDDWTLIEKISMIEIEKIFKNNNLLKIIRLRPAIHTKTPKIDCCQYGLSPCIIRKQFYSEMAKKINIKHDPEWQIRQSQSIKIQQEEVMCYPDNIVCVDIGEEWRRKHKIRKPSKKKKFITWEN